MSKEVNQLKRKYGESVNCEEGGSDSDTPSVTKKVEVRNDKSKKAVTNASISRPTFIKAYFEKFETLPPEKRLTLQRKAIDGRRLETSGKKVGSAIVSEYMPAGLAIASLDAFYSYINVSVMLVQPSLFYRDISLYIYGHSFFQTGKDKVSLYNESYISEAETNNHCSRPSNCYFSPSLLAVILAFTIDFLDGVSPKISESIKEYAISSLSETITQSPLVPNLQAYLLQSMSELSHGNFSQAWLYAGIASRQISELNLDSNLSDKDNIERKKWLVDSEEDLETRRRFSWLCFFWDKFISLYLNRVPVLPYPPHCPPNDITATCAEDIQSIDFPSHIIPSEYHKQASDMSEPRKPLDKKYNTTDVLICASRLSMVLDGLLNSIYSKRQEIALPLKSVTQKQQNEDNIKIPASHLYFVRYIPTDRMRETYTPLLQASWDELPDIFKFKVDHPTNVDEDPELSVLNPLALTVNVLYSSISAILVRTKHDDNTNSTNSSNISVSSLNSLKLMKDILLRAKEYPKTLKNPLCFPTLTLNAHIGASLSFSLLEVVESNSEQYKELQNNILCFLSYMDETTCLTSEMVGDSYHIKNSEQCRKFYNSSTTANDNVHNDFAPINLPSYKSNTGVNIPDSNYGLFSPDFDTSSTSSMTSCIQQNSMTPNMSGQMEFTPGNTIRTTESYIPSPDFNVNEPVSSNTCPMRSSEYQDLERNSEPPSNPPPVNFPMTDITLTSHPQLPVISNVISNAVIPIPSYPTTYQPPSGCPYAQASLSGMPYPLPMGFDIDINRPMKCPYTHVNTHGF